MKLFALLAFGALLALALTHASAAGLVWAHLAPIGGGRDTRRSGVWDGRGWRWFDG